MAVGERTTIVKYLFLDTSQFKVFGQIGDDQGFQSFFWETRRDLANRITLLIDEMLEKSGVTFEKVDLLGVCGGPGSLTGLRVGFSFMRSLAHVAEKKLVSVDLFSWAVRSLLESSKNAGNNNVGAQHFAPLPFIIPAFLDHVFLDVWDPTVNQEFQAHPRLEKKTELPSETPGFSIRSETHGFQKLEPSAEALHQIMMETLATPFDFHDLLLAKPMYVAPSQAELKLEMKSV